MGYMKAMRPQAPGRGPVKIEQGYYNPVNRLKYIGPVDRIIYRSGLEKEFMVECDTNPQIIRWQSEPDFLNIRYINPFKRRMATYYPDFYVQFNSKTKGLLHLVIEIKASNMMEIPKGGIAKMSNFVKKAFVLNQTKKQAAEKICASKGMIYLVMTDKSDFFK